MDVARIDSLRASGDSWRTISEKLGVGIGTLYNAVHLVFEKGVSGRACKSLIPSTWIQTSSTIT